MNREEELQNEVDELETEIERLQKRWGPTIKGGGLVAMLTAIVTYVASLVGHGHTGDILGGLLRDNPSRVATGKELPVLIDVLGGTVKGRSDGYHIFLSKEDVPGMCEVMKKLDTLSVPDLPLPANKKTSAVESVPVPEAIAPEKPVSEATPQQIESGPYLPEEDTEKEEVVLGGDPGKVKSLASEGALRQSRATLEEIASANQTPGSKPPAPVPMPKKPPAPLEPEDVLLGAICNSNVRHKFVRGEDGRLALEKKPGHEKCTPKFEVWKKKGSPVEQWKEIQLKK